MKGIVEIKVPKDCCDCLLGHIWAYDDEILCNVTRKHYPIGDVTESRPSDCPIRRCEDE